MSWVTIIWSMIASVSFTLATIYLLIWFRERRSWAYLCFFVLAAGVIGMATGEMAAMYAKSPAAYGAAIRWGHFAYGFIAVGSLGFVHFYFGTGKRWLLGAALGERTGELHLALASDLEDPDFAPVPFTTQYQRSVFQSMRTVAGQNLRLLRKQLKTLPADLLPLAQRVVEAEPAIIQRYRQFYECQLTARRIRIHGDFHLGQVLWTGKDFALVDFESETATAMSERRIKLSPLRDVAGLVRSLHYAAYAGLHQHVERGGIPLENLPRFESWVRHWSLWVSVSFLKGYLHHVGPSGLLPVQDEELRAMLRAYWLNNMVIELGRELRHPAGRLQIPLQGILRLVEGQTPPSPADATAGTSNLGVKPPPLPPAIE